MNGRRGPTWQDIAQGVLSLLMGLMLWWVGNISGKVEDLATTVTEGLTQLQERTRNMDKTIMDISGKLDGFARREALKDLSDRVDRLHNR